MSAARSRSLQKTLLASNSAAALLGPKIRRPSAWKASTIPAASGPSGPTTVSPTSLSWAKLDQGRKIVGRRSARFRRRCRCRRCPGRRKRGRPAGLCEIFQARACSRPPLPMIRTFMIVQHPFYGDVASRAGWAISRSACPTDQSARPDCNGKRPSGKGGGGCCGFPASSGLQRLTLGRWDAITRATMETVRPSRKPSTTRSGCTRSSRWRPPRS